MLGGMLAGHDESGGDLEEVDGKHFKVINYFYFFIFTFSLNDNYFPSILITFNYFKTRSRIESLIFVFCLSIPNSDLLRYVFGHRNEQAFRWRCRVPRIRR